MAIKIVNDNPKIHPVWRIFFFVLVFLTQIKFGISLFSQLRAFILKNNCFLPFHFFETIVGRHLMTPRAKFKSNHLKHFESAANHHCTKSWNSTTTNLRFQSWSTNCYVRSSWLLTCAADGHWRLRRNL